jgi:hypothetical protein
MKVLLLLSALLLASCGPTYVESHQIGTVTCYKVNGGQVIGKWDPAYLHYSNYDGRDHVKVYLTTAENDAGLTKLRRHDDPVANWHVDEAVCTLTRH